MDKIIDFLMYLQDLPTEFWTTVLGVLITSGVISIFLQFAKKHFKLDGKKTVASLLSLMTLAASVTDFLVTNNPGSPLPEITQYWAYVMAAAVVLHRFFVSPLYRRLAEALKAFGEKVDSYKQEKYNAPLPDRTIDDIAASLKAAEPDTPKLAE